MAGKTCPNGLPAKKPTEFTANSRLLLRPLESLKCDTSHEHDNLEGRGSKACQVWPWKLAKRIVDGIALLKAAVSGQYMYPSVGSGSNDVDEPQPDEVPDEAWKNCPGCTGRQSATDTRHNRIPGVCKHPLVQPDMYDCKGCQAHRPSGHGDHTYETGRCRWSVTDTRTGKRRSGKHPRPPAVKASASPTADLQAQLPDGTDLGAEDESRAAASGPSSSSNGPTASVPGSLLDPVAQTRGPDQEQRVRRTFADQASGTTVPSDWSKFDVSSSLRALRTGTNASQQRELRKLHLRWWHAPKVPMKNILQSCGLPSEVIDMIPGIVDTCRECRAWEPAGAATQSAVRISYKFNEHVEFDLMFYKQFIVFHLICRLPVGTQP